MTGRWPTKPLKDVCIVDWGNTSLTKSAYIDGGEYIAVSAAGCDGRIGHKEHEKFTPVLSAIGAQCGRMFLPEEDFTAIKNTITLTPRAGICTGRFLYQLLTYIDLPKRGAAQPFISKGDIQSFHVPVPPLAEQERIVAKLDEAFAAIDNAKENAEKNVINARTILESALNTIFSKKGEGWIEKRLDEVGNTQTGSTPNTNDSTNYGHYIPFLKPADFKKDGSLEYENNGLSEKGMKESRKVASGSVLMVCIGATIGKCGYCERDITTNQQINSFTPSTRVFYKFIYYQMLTETFQRSVMDSSAQATLPIISKSKWNALVIALPPTLEEQKAIVSKLDELSTRTQRLGSIYQRKLSELESVKKSFLHHAFTGQL